MKADRSICVLVAALSLFASSQVEAAEGIPLVEAGTSPEQVFPERLSAIKADCSFRRTRNPPVLSDLERNWYSRHLVAAGEPSLVSIAEAAPDSWLHVRFIWLRSFHAPVIVRVEATSPSEMNLTAKLLSGAGGYEPGEVAQQVDRRLESEEFRRIKDFLEKSRLVEEPSETCDLGLDGAQWIVEVVQGDRYFFLDRWTPQEGPVRELGLLMLGLTGWSIGSEDIY